MRVSNVIVRKRLVFVLIGGLLIMFVMGIRLGYIQLFIGDWLTGRAMELWSRDIVN
ncbi:hypothetical protein [Siminovitchia sp. 179-K 8D1 HS]|uniref:hypothetical protein n=1 Tax=Siminovitchia sp. 179-K 8D1 HS TaxID=3142385 RepID=UPI0039A0DF14